MLNSRDETRRLMLAATVDCRLDACATMLAGAKLATSSSHGAEGAALYQIGDKMHKSAERFARRVALHYYG